MSPAKRDSGRGYSAAAAALAPDSAALDRLIKENPAPEQVCAQLSKMFHVRPTEVALMRLEDGLLKFLFPEQLKTAGAIPISSSSAIAAHTAVTRKVELFNTFAKVKHASIFESIKLDKAEKNDQPEHAPIQKLMSAPVLDPQGKVLGVIQISRKGFDLSSCGPDFTLDDLQQIESATKTLAHASFLRPSTRPR